MSGDWQLLVDLAPDAEGYQTSTASALTTRIMEALARCGEPNDVVRVRVVLGEGHTLLRYETCSERVCAEFQALGGPDIASGS